MATPYLRPNVEADDLRQEALDRAGRWKRQQGELFRDELYPECPNCGEHAQPVYGISEDSSVGYHSEEAGCVACIEKIAEPEPWSRQDWEDHYGDIAADEERD